MKRIDYELMVKGRAKINNEGWRKLRGYHFKSYVSQLDNPFGFVFYLRYKQKQVFRQIPCANNIYRVVLEKRQESFK